MEEKCKEELELLNEIVKNYLSGIYFIENNQKIFGESEILEWVLQGHKWSVKIRILLMNFIDIAKKYGNFTLKTIGFCINCLLYTKHNLWFRNLAFFEKVKGLIFSYLQSFFIEKEKNICEMTQILKIAYQGNSLFFDKTNTDLIIIEAFLNVLGIYKGSNFKECTKLIWVKDICEDFPVKIVKGLLLQKSAEGISGNNLICHFCDSIPSSLEATCKSRENPELSSKILENYSRKYSEFRVRLIICQKNISESLKRELKDSNIKFIEKIGSSDSDYITRITKKSPKSSFYLLTEKNLSNLELLPFSYNSKNFLIIPSESMISIIYSSILPEDFLYFSTIIDSSFKVNSPQLLYNYFFKSKSLIKSPDFESILIPDWLKSELETYLSSMPQNDIVLEYLDHSFFSIFLYLRSSSLSLFSLFDPIT